MKKISTLSGVALALIPALASAQFNDSWNQRDPFYNNVRWQTVAQGSDSAITQSGSWIIRDQNSWNQMWSRLRGTDRYRDDRYRDDRNRGGYYDTDYDDNKWNEHDRDDRWRNGSSTYGAPAVADWRYEQVLILNLGRAQAGTSLSVRDIQYGDSWAFNVYFNIREVISGYNPYNQRYVNPYVIVKMNRMDGRANFYRVDNRGYFNRGNNAGNFGSSCSPSNNGEPWILTPNGPKRQSEIDRDRNNGGGRRGNGNGRG